MLKIEIPLDQPERMLRIAAVLTAIAETFNSPKAGGEGKEREKTIAEEPISNTNEDLKTAQYQAPPTASDTRTDEKGVAHDPRYCTETILKTGPMKGQWRKKGAVSQEAYDAWYSSQVQAEPKQVEEAPTSGSLFADTPVPGDAPSVQSAPAVVPNVPPQTPQTAGELCKWVSIHTAAGMLTAAQVDEAYRQSATTLADLVSSDPDTAARKCAAVHAILFNIVSKR